MMDKPSPIPTLDEHHYFLFNTDFDPSSCGSAMAFILQRSLMKPKDRPSQIKLLINSPGGQVPSAFALIDCIKGSPIPIWTFGLGEVSSCGLLTFMAGQKGKRFLTRNTAILSHQFSWGAVGKEHELFAKVEEYSNVQERILNHYKKCTGLSEKKIKEVLLPANDVWLTPKDAVKYGIADSIVDFY